MSSGVKAQPNSIFPFLDILQQEREKHREEVTQRQFQHSFSSSYRLLDNLTRYLTSTHPSPIMSEKRIFIATIRKERETKEIFMRKSVFGF